VLIKSGERTACFTATLNGKGDFLSGVADMDILTNISKAHLDRFKPSKVLMVDSNIGIETLGYVLEGSTKVQHVLFEPISKEKAGRILKGGLLSYVTILKPNILQLRDLASELESVTFNPDFKDLTEEILGQIH